MVMALRLPMPVLAALWLLWPGPAAGQDSPLFQGTTADVWLVDPESGQVTGYDRGNWIEDFIAGDYPGIDLGSGEAILINRLPQSSVPMQPGQPLISLAGLGDPALMIGQGGDGGHPDLIIVPGEGAFTDTLAVNIGVSRSLLVQDDHLLIVSVVETGSGSTIADESIVIRRGAGEGGENGYFTKTYYLVNTGTYDITARVRGTTVDKTENATLTLTIDPDRIRRDTDGDGIPDAVEIDMGLNPLEDDWTADTDGNGWSQFDEWLRRYCLDPNTLLPLDAGPECLDADGLPVDTDADDWTDFDEILRGTNHLDPEPFGAAVPPPADITEAEARERLRFKDFPAANRLYEIERVIGAGEGALDVPPLANILPSQQSAGPIAGNYEGIVVQSITAVRDNIAGVDFRVAASGVENDLRVEDVILNIWGDALRDGELLLSHTIRDVRVDGEPGQAVIVRFEPVAVTPGQTIYLEFRKDAAAIVTTAADTLAGGGVVEIDGAAAAGDTDLLFDLFHDGNFANGIGGTRAGMQWWTAGAAAIDGAVAYDAMTLLRSAEISDAGLSPADIAPRRRMSVLANAFGSNELPPMRLPAGDSVVVSAVHRHSLPAVQGARYGRTADYSRVYKYWLPRSDDLTPATMLADMGEGAWTTPDEWRREFVAYLAPRLVVPQSFTLDERSTFAVTVVEAALATEAELDGSGGLAVLARVVEPPRPAFLFNPAETAYGDFQPGTSPWIDEWEDHLKRLAAPGFNLDQGIAAVSAALEAGQPLEPVADWLRENFYSGVPGTSSDTYLSSQFIGAFPDVCFVPAEDLASRQADVEGWNDFLDQCPAYVDETGLGPILEAERERKYRVRINLLPGAAAEIGTDPTLLDLTFDSDADGALNATEIELPVRQLTLPWLADSDGDMIGDNDDPCPNDPFNDCSANPIRPTIVIDADFAVNEPETGVDFALVSIQLSRIYDVPVTVCYEAIMDVADTATADVDFDAVTGCVTIAPGQLSALIRIPINADGEIDAGETFTVRITSITNGMLADDGVVVITINDPLPSENQAPVFTSADNVSVAEGMTDTGYTAAATDPDGDTLVFSTSGGTDEAAFTIDPATGVLSFVTAPDFDAPADANGDNAYEVQLTVDDGNGGTDTLDLVVTVVETGIEVAMTFPTPGANLGGDVTSTMVRGNVTDPAGAALDPSAITSLSVNGAAATIDTSDSGHWLWSVAVPVTAGSNTLSVSYELGDGSSESFDVAVENYALHLNFDDLELDTVNGRLLVIDTFEDELFSVDLVTGARAPFSGDNVGTGVTLLAPTGFLVDAPNNRVLLVDAGRDALFAIDLATGDRTILSDGSLGTGPGLVGPGDVAYDSANDRAIVIDQQLDAALFIDLATGDRTIISDATIGTGPAMGNPRDVVYDAEGNRLLVADGTLDALIEIDIASGDRTVISDATTGTGTTISSPENIALDAANNRVLLTEQLRGLIAVDLASGNRTVLNAPTDDYTLNGSRLSGLATDLAGGTVYLSDYYVDAIFAVDLGTGERSIVSSSHVGTTAGFLTLFGLGGIDYDEKTGRVVLTDPSGQALWAIDVATAHTSLVSGRGKGSGPDITSLSRLAVDPANGLAYYHGLSEDTLFVADLATGDRAVASGDGVGGGPALAALQDVTLDLAAERALALGLFPWAVYSIDLATGDRTLISNESTGSGPAFEFPAAIVYDELANRVLVLDRDADSLFAVDLATGDRLVLSDNAGVGTGPAFSLPFDMEPDVANNRIIAADRDGNLGIMAVDLASGDRTLLSANSVGTGVQVWNNYFVALDARNERAFVYDLTTTAIFVVDLPSGQRAVASK